MENNEFTILILSDMVADKLYGLHIRDIFPDVDLILSCGDLPYYYLEFILDMLRAPMFFVHGNHDPAIEIGVNGNRSQPGGARNLDNEVINHQGLLLAGLEGSIRYSKAIYQYTQFQMWLKALRLVPKLLANRIRYGRYLDILVSHSPAWGVGDKDDPAHQGFHAIRWILKVFKPKYHLHGHVHLYSLNEKFTRMFEETMIINASRYRILKVNLDQ